jgi:hypothetical protein
VLKASEPWAGYAIANKIHLIGGDYWSVWPTVFVLLARGETVYGYAPRGDSNGEPVRALLEPGLKAMCLNASSTTCIAQARFITGLEWQAAEACGAGCSIIELR